MRQAQFRRVGVEGGGRGIWNISGGTGLLGAELSIGRNGGTGTLNVCNTGIIVVANALYLGQDPGGNGTVNQTGGTVSNTNQWTTIGASAGATGVYNISAGVLNPHFLEVGADGTGTMNVSGTGQVLAESITIGLRNTGAGVVNVNGGLLKSNGHISLGGDLGRIEDVSDRVRPRKRIATSPRFVVLEH